MLKLTCKSIKNNIKKVTCKISNTLIIFPILLLIYLQNFLYIFFKFKIIFGIQFLSKYILIYFDI